MVTIFSALSSSRLVTMIPCRRSSSDDSVFTFFTRGVVAFFGPAAIVFLRGLPGTAPASASFGFATVLRGTGLCRAGEAAIFGVLVITRFLWRLGGWR